ncbi:hypothetical protein FGG08_005422 [Glutinoglossum americanum]|uniref:Ribosome quality control complex subunit 2 n=1 Tax=Glutinoglossum americanum TaxID=1670608 RepID=A0A9P8L1F3_9PEZI|nr:hypothetical protein FGG08_005422 [Glutinoglossum americanum]
MSMISLRSDQKQQMIIESGFRCHLTSFSRTTAPAPSPFVVRLRKFLRSRRVTAVSQIGTDRIIEIQFSDGQYRLFLEFYAGGNIVLTDKEYNILALLRIVNEQEELRVGLKYSLENRQNVEGVPPLTKERLKNALEKAAGKKQVPDLGSDKKPKRGADVLRKALAVSITEYPPMLVEHVLRVSGFGNSTRPGEVLEDDELIEKLLLALYEAGRIIQDITSAEVSKGYIIAKPRVKSVATSSDTPTLGDGPEKVDESDERRQFTYEDFHPFLPRQIEDDPSLKVFTFDGFNKTVDEFVCEPAKYIETYSSIEGQKLESRLNDRDDNAKKRLETARNDHEKRVDGLKEVQLLNVRKAQAIEANLARVEETMTAINSLIGQGMDWMEIARLVEMEKTRKNPVAEIIKLPLKLYENTATLLLGEAEEGEEDFEGDETDSDVVDSDKDTAPNKPKAGTNIDKRLSVDIDLGLSPWANARQYYDQKRSAAVKEQKTLQSSSKALKSTEKKITADLKKGLKQEKQVLRPIRAPQWFEKFYFFISSDGYLVLGGRDMMQTEILYKRYLKRGDVYVHADIQGAASVIIKNNPATPDAPIPPSTLSQAGNLAVAPSKAWDSKAILSAWWVNSDQVSKTAPTGEYLTTGGFVIRGEKNFLPPAQLLLGFAVMFRISEESKAHHMKHRLDGQTDTDGISTAEAAVEMPDEHTTVDAEGPTPTLESDDEDFPDARLESGSEDEDGGQSGVGGGDPFQGGNPDQIDSRLQATTTQDKGGDISESSSRNDDTAEDKYGSASGLGKGGDRHMSARERRLLRKARDGMSSIHEAGVGDDDKSVNTGSTGAHLILVDPEAGGRGTPNTIIAQKPQVRGKRGKQKKLATKYANQDEEDRALAMRFLGSTATKEKTEEAEKVKAAKEKELAAQKQRREQHDRAAAKGKEYEEARRTMLEENPEALDDEEQLPATPLDGFVGTPLPGDEILDAIPVCAPWTALSRYKYKAKLQPGIVKKGKAVRGIVTSWITEGERRKIDQKSEDVEKMWPRESELLKGWRYSELTNTIPVGNVKVLMSGTSGSGVSSKWVSNESKAKGGKGSKKRR